MAVSVRGEIDNHSFLSEGERIEIVECKIGEIYNFIINVKCVKEMGRGKDVWTTLAS